MLIVVFMSCKVNPLWHYYQIYIDKMAYLIRFFTIFTVKMTYSPTLGNSTTAADHSVYVEFKSRKTKQQFRRTDAVKLPYCTPVGSRTLIEGTGILYSIH